MKTNHLHVDHLILELKRISAEGIERVADYDDDGLHISIASSLMNDAAEALDILRNDLRQSLEYYHKTDSPSSRRCGG
jgi:hypothetical protein